MLTDLIDRLNLTDAEITYLTTKKSGVINGHPPLPMPPVARSTKMLVKGMCHEYSTMSPIDPKHRGILIQHSGGAYGLHRATDGGLDQMLPAQINHSAQPRWMREDPDCLLFTYLNQLRKWNAGTGAIETIRTFKEYPNVNGMGESDLIHTAPLIALTGGPGVIITYNYKEDKVPFAFIPWGDFDNFYLTPAGDVIVGYKKGVIGGKSGHVLHKTTGIATVLATGLGHMDCAADKTGNPIMVWCNSEDDSGENRKAKVPGCENRVVFIDLESGKQTCLTQIPWGFAMHISLPDKADFALVSIYNADKSENLIVNFNGVMTALDRPHAPSYLDYETQPHASITSDGTQYTYNDGGDTWVGNL